MKDKNMNFIKGMGAGVITGAAIATATKMMISSNKNSFSKSAGKTMKAVGNIAESIHTMLK